MEGGGRGGMRVYVPSETDNCNFYYKLGGGGGGAFSPKARGHGPSLPLDTHGNSISRNGRGHPVFYSTLNFNIL